MNKILIVNPPIVAPKPISDDRQGLASVYVLASYLRQQKQEVQVFDFVLGKRELDGWENERIVRIAKCGNFENEQICKKIYYVGCHENAYVKFLKAYKPNEVWISCLFTFGWEGTEIVYNVTREFNPLIKIKIGGNYANLCEIHAKNIFSEAEIILSKSDDVSRFTKIDLGFFRRIPMMFPILTSLGCPYNCGWCAVPYLEGHNMKFRNPYEVVDDLEEKNAYGIDEFKFLDSNIMANYDNHFKIILNEIIKRNLKLKLHVYGGINPFTINQEVLGLMAIAGFVRIQIPIELIDERVLKANNRLLTPRMWSDAVKKLKKIQFTEIVSFMLCGMPNQTMTDIYRTITFLEMHDVCPSPLFFTPIPKTRYEDNTRKLEDLNPFLYPYASPDMTTRQLEELYCKYCPSGMQVPELITMSGEYISSPSILIKDKP